MEDQCFPVCSWPGSGGYHLAGMHVVESEWQDSHLASASSALGTLISVGGQVGK